MPCYTSRLYSIDFEAGNRSVLEAAVKALGWSLRTDKASVTHVRTPEGYISLQGGQAVVNDNRLVPHINELRKEYSKQAVGYVCNKYGWQKTTAGENRYVISKGM